MQQRGYQLPNNILDQLGLFDNIITRYQPGITLSGRVLVHCLTKNDEPTVDLFMEHRSGLLVVNTRVETIQFQNLLDSAHSVLLLKGRVRYRDMKYNKIIQSNAPFGTAIFSFGQADTKVLEEANLVGKLLKLYNEIPEFA